MKKRLRLGASITTLVSLLSAPLYADSFHYVNQLIGERASGLGGAYTAIADDASGLFYNPAGIVYSSGRNLSGSVNSFYSATTTYNDALDTGLDWTRTSSSILPNFFGMIQPFGKGTIGFSYAVTDSILEDQDQTFNNFGNIDKFIINFNNQSTTTKIGPTYAQSITDSLSIGVTLYGHMRSAQFIQNQEIFTSATHPAPSAYEWRNEYRQLSEFGFTPILGVMWNPVDKLSVGVQVKTTTILSSTYDTQFTCISDIAAAIQAEAQCLPSGSTLLQLPATASITTNGEYPVSTAVGIAYFPTNELLLSGDFTYHSATNSAETTWNLAAGAEYYLSPKWALRGGIYTDRANTPQLSSTSTTTQVAHIDNTGVTASISRFTRNSSLSLGMNIVTGSGNSQLFGPSTALQDIDYQSLTLFLASSYSY